MTSLYRFRFSVTFILTHDYSSNINSSEPSVILSTLGEDKERVAGVYNHWILMGKINVVENRNLYNNVKKKYYFFWIGESVPRKLLYRFNQNCGSLSSQNRIKIFESKSRGTGNTSYKQFLAVVLKFKMLFILTQFEHV